MRVVDYLKSQQKVLLTVIGFLLVILLGINDYFTSPELSFSVFSLVPISLVVWFVGRGTGIVISVVSAGLWLYLIGWHASSSLLVAFWNTATRLGFYLVGLVSDAVSTRGRVNQHAGVSDAALSLMSRRDVFV
jgi:membrane-associated HD superfamily phosphohydrolase